MIIGFDASRSFKPQRTGTENYSYEILKHLLSIDQVNQYRVYLRNGEGKDDLLLKRQNVAAVDIRQPRLWTQFGLAFEVLRRKTNILFVPAHTLPIIHRPGLRSIVTVHDLGAEYLPQYHQFPQKLYLNRSTEYAVSHATHLIAVSEATKQDLVKKLHANPDKISVIYEGYDVERFHTIDQAMVRKIRSKYRLIKPYFLFVGTIQPRKNLERLIQAFAMATGNGHLNNGSAAKMRELSEIELILVGKRGWLSDPIYQAPQKFGVANRVHFIDYVDDDDLPGLYAGAQAFVFPSLYEGFGLPVLEAMACRVPLITSNCSSLPEVAGDAAIQVDPANASAIATAMLDIGDAERRQTLIMKGQKQIQLFNWAKAAQQTLAVLQNVAENES